MVKRVGNPYRYPERWMLRGKDLTAEVTVNWEEYAYPLVHPPKWFADKAAIKAKLRTSDVTTYRLMKLLDDQILVDKPPPKYPHTGPYDYRTQEKTDRYGSQYYTRGGEEYSIHKEYVGSVEQREAYIPLGRADKYRSTISESAK